jgi:hypothetical protein
MGALGTSNSRASDGGGVDSDVDSGTSFVACVDPDTGSSGDEPGACGSSATGTDCCVTSGSEPCGAGPSSRDGALAARAAGVACCAPGVGCVGGGDAGTPCVPPGVGCAGPASWAESLAHSTTVMTNAPSRPHRGRGAHELEKLSRARAVQPEATRARLHRDSLEVTVDRAADLPRSQGGRTTHSGDYVEDEQHSERSKDRARRGHFKQISA